MNRHTQTEDIIESLPDDPLPSHLHARIMRRVFLAEYGKHLILSTSILVINVVILGFDLYRTFTDANVSSMLQNLKDTFVATPAYFERAAATLYDILPVQSIIATGLTVALASYIAIVFAKVYRNPQGIQIRRIER